MTEAADVISSRHHHSMTESQRAFHLKGIANSPKNGSSVVRCYFMRRGHIAAVQELSGLFDQEATNRSHNLFSELKEKFDGFELWDRARMLIQHPKPSDLSPKRDDRGQSTRRFASVVKCRLFAPRVAGLSKFSFSVGTAHAEKPFSRGTILFD
jgi:hypothetical protein